jgi:hypothetical protein
MAILTVGDLIDALGEFDRGTPIQLAVQPAHPFAHSIGSVVAAEVYAVADLDGRKDVVYVADGGQLDYLNGDAREALGW